MEELHKLIPDLDIVWVKDPKYEYELPTWMRPVKWCSWQWLYEYACIHVSVVALCRNRQKAEQYFGSYVGKSYFRLLIQDVCEPIAYEGKVDYVFHLAGNSSPYFINTDPVGIMKCNLQGTFNVLELARHHDAKRVLFASTREVYGRKAIVPIVAQA